MLIRYACIFLIFTGLIHPVFPIIVWDGKVVTAWPDRSPRFLCKSAAGSGGFGFFSRPTDTINAVTMIIDFSDQAAVFTKEQVADWLNKPGFDLKGSKGSVRDYYHDCSNGRLELVNDVVGYYRAARTKAYYEGLPGYSGSDELVEEALNYFDPAVDFSKYDNDRNGMTESINFVYAGSGKTYAQGLWPHASTYGKKRDGVTIGRYNMSDMGNQLSLYVFCHETGHALFGWPDLYYFGDFCVMGNRMSEMNPQAVNDFFRADQGWIPTTDVVSADNKAFTARHNGGGFRYVNPAVPGEMFYWSVLNNTGRWSNVSGHGILIYHFDDRISGNFSAEQRSLFVVEADGNNKLASGQWPSPGDEATDFFNAETKSVFSSTTTPSSLWGLEIYAVSAAADSMSFSVGTGAVGVMPVVPCREISADRTGLSTLQYDLLGRAIGTGRYTGMPLMLPVPGCYVSPSRSAVIVTGKGSAGERP